MSELHLILVGSPRVRGASARFAEQLARMLEAQGNVRGVHDARDVRDVRGVREDSIRVEVFSVAENTVSGCLGCGYCDAKPECVIKDDMTQLYALLGEAAAVHVVSPVYFSGLPAQLKAVIDRCQLFYQQWRRNREAGLPRAPKRPLALYLFGDGGDPHGTSSAETEVRSAFAVAGFALANTQAFIGKDKTAQSLDFLKNADELALRSEAPANAERTNDEGLR